MTNKLSLDRDFTRFLKDSSFPFRVTAHIGDEKIICSGVIIAQQSLILDRKIRDDEGALIFEEFMETKNECDALKDCIGYLHGADLVFTHDNLATVLKFSSLYELNDLFSHAIKWIQPHLQSTKSLEDAIKYLKVSNCFENKIDSDLLRCEIKQFIRSNFDTFGLLDFERYIDDEMSGLEFITIFDENLPDYGYLLEKWASLSLKNRHFIIQNHITMFDFNKIFPEVDNFLSFITLVSEEITSATSLKILLSIQKSFFSTQNSKNLVTENNINLISNHNTLPDSKKNPNSAANHDCVSSCTSLSALSDFDVPEWSCGSHFDEISDHVPSCTSRSTLSDISVPELPCSSQHCYETSQEEEKQEEEKDNKNDVYVWNLPSEVTKKDLNKLFCFAGVISKIHIWFEYAMAIIKFTSATSAWEVINDSQHFILFDYKLRISRPVRNNQVLIWNVPQRTSKKALTSLFHDMGKIQKIAFFQKELHAVIDFHEADSAARLRDSDKDFSIHGVLLDLFSEFKTYNEFNDEDVNYESCKEDFNNLYIGNIPVKADYREIWQLFSGYGKIVELTIRSKNHDVNYGFITFEKSKSACHVYHNSRSGSFLCDSNKLKIRRVIKS